MGKYWFGIVCVIVAILSVPFSLAYGWILVQYSFFTFIGGLVAFLVLANVTRNYENEICTLALLIFIFSFIVFAVSLIILSIRGFVRLII